jgi:hypothetical protein
MAEPLAAVAGQPTLAAGNVGIQAAHSSDGLFDEVRLHFCFSFSNTS